MHGSWRIAAYSRPAASIPAAPPRAGRCRRRPRRSARAARDLPRIRRRQRQPVQPDPAATPEDVRASDCDAAFVQHRAYLILAAGPLAHQLVPAASSTSAAQYQPYVASTTTCGFSLPGRSPPAARPSCSRSGRSPACARPPSSAPARCAAGAGPSRRPVGRHKFRHRGPPLPGGDGCFATSSIRQERRPAPSSHHVWFDLRGCGPMAVPPTG
jgi:hypothetical protein